ncbi:MAG: hypothetical protein EOM12_03430 [Verrucomicrobiae bacterium]|nr:hypothetical protein [Verrucomicrobiae bacterium]
MKYKDATKLQPGDRLTCKHKCLYESQFLVSETGRGYYNRQMVAPGETFVFSEIIPKVRIDSGPGQDKFSEMLFCHLENSDRRVWCCISNAVKI